MSTYDAWLERPYDDAARREALAEQFAETDEYREALTEWAMETKYDDFTASSAFEIAFEAWIEAMGERDE